MKRILIALFALVALGFGLAQDATVDMSDRSIAEILNATEEVSILDLMVEAAGLEESLNTGGPFTVFAPLDRAWLELDSSTIRAVLTDPDTLQSVLLYHVISGDVESGQLFELLLSDARLRIGDENTPGMEVEDPVDALLATGVTSAVAFDTVQGAMLEVVAARTADTTEDTGQRIGEGDRLLDVAAPVAALRAEGVDLMVGDAHFVHLDIVASNGVIHLIDSVLVPKGLQLPD